MSLCVAILQCNCSQLHILLTNYFASSPYTVIVQEVRQIYYQIHIEPFFLINLILLYSTWNISTSILSVSVTQKRIIRVSLMGAAINCLFLFAPIRLWYRLFFGAVASLVIGMKLLFAGYRRKGKVLFVVSLTGIMTGACIGLLQKWQLVKELSPIGISVLLLLLPTGTGIIKQRFFVKKQGPFYPVILVQDGRTIRMLALLDTGNGLIEPISKKPVCLVEKKFLEENMAKEGGRIEFHPHKFRVIPYHSVGKENGILRGYEMDRLIIDTDERRIMVEKPMIGIIEGRVSVNGTYRMILQPELLVEGEKKE